MALVDAASAMLDRLFVVVAVNSQKPTGMFPVRVRLEMLTLATRHLGNVQVAAHDGLLIDIAARLGADVLLRSAGRENAIERQMAYLNGRNGLRTLLIPPDPDTAFISSSQVRGLVAAGAPDAASKLLPAGLSGPGRGGQWIFRPLPQ